MAIEDGAPAKPRRMRLGLSVGSVGTHDAAWRLPDLSSVGAMGLQHHIKAAEIAERGLMDFLLVGEHAQLKMDPTMVAAALAAVTDRVGLVATGSATYQHPYNFARRMASIDHISGGRLGWKMVTGSDADEAGNFNLDAPLGSDMRHARAVEFVSVVHGLFDSWDEDAFPRDKVSGIYLDRAKIRFLDHGGKFFRVRGPLDVARPPQGRIPIVTAGVSDDAMELAARFADIATGDLPGIAAARAYCDAVKGRLDKYGRAPGDILMMPGIHCHLGQTQGEAEDKFARQQALLDPSLCMIGTPKMVADSMEEWFTTGAADGFLVQVPSMADGAEDFVALVIPELQRRGFFRMTYEGWQLRANLGLVACPDLGTLELAQTG